jgi:thiosulfate/3-mercaptopyruvate sulfurtransferase
MKPQLKLWPVPYSTLIDAETLAPLVGQPDLIIVDCRFDLMNPAAGREAYLVGHIPGARYADLNRDLSAPPGPQSGRHPLPEPRTFAATLGRMGIGAGTQVIAYDEVNGSMAARLWWLLRWIGHPQVAVLDGGLAAWRARGGALADGEEPAAVAPAPLIAQPQEAAVLSSRELVQTLGTWLLVDARAAERYAGRAEPIDSVAGHVPGAINHPFTDNLDAAGRFLPAAELRRRWQSRLERRDAHEVVAMCGSGVTACHNLLGLELAGMSGARLYAGSWSEWIKDPERPIARG